MDPSELGHTLLPSDWNALKNVARDADAADQSQAEQAEQPVIHDFLEWEKRQPGYGASKRQEPTLKERGIDVSAAPGDEPTGGDVWAELLKARNKAIEDNYSPDEIIDIGADGKPIYRRRPTGGEDQRPPVPVGVPPDGDGAVDLAMDIYREHSRGADGKPNYPKDAPIDEQQGFAVAASTQDYNKGYSQQEPVAAQVVTYDGRRGEVREFGDGSTFFVSLEDDVILRMHDVENR